MDIHQATRAYESWVRQHIPVVEPDLRTKHANMAVSPFIFLRATFYRWIQQWPTVCKALNEAPHVLAVGDLHIENFGTWRDIEGRLIWGVNDIDEAYELPYTQDLTRLATSALLAIRAEHLALSVREACEAIVEGYRASLDQRGRPFVLAERHRWLRQIALNKLRDPKMFWRKLLDCPPAKGAVPQRELRSFLPDRTLPLRVLRRVAGQGSLGRPRFVALARWGGALTAREAKAVLPSAVVWARGESKSAVRCADLVRSAVRVPDPFFEVTDRWIVRRLAPDCTRIEITELPRKRDEAKLLRAMGWETANMHLGSRTQQVARDIAGRRGPWLRRAATEMMDVVVEDWHQWVGRRAAGPSPPRASK